MSDLVNIIKNIDPPIELTSMQYGNLTEQQKNGGNVFYVRDGNGNKQIAATTFAESLHGQNSNVQAEINKLNNTFDNIINGPLPVNTAKYIEGGSLQFHTDSYGNFIHNSSATGNAWDIHNFNDTIESMRTRYQYGHIINRVRSAENNSWVENALCHAENVTFSDWYYGAGYITNSSKTIKILLPIITCTQTATITKIRLCANHIKGGYCYMKYGNSYLPLNWDTPVIWENSAQKYANSISSVSATIRRGWGINIAIDFVNPLVTSTAGTTNVTTLTPSGIVIVPTITFS